MDITIIPTIRNGMSKRINVDKTKVAICVSPGMCIQSRITSPVETNGPIVKLHKFISVMLHDQDWERWESFMCLVFSQPFMYCNITNLAVQFGSRFANRDDETKVKEPSYEKSDVDATMRSPVRVANCGTTAAAPQAAVRQEHSVKYALAVEDIVPVFDARSRDFDFNTQLPDIAKVLPCWKGEVPVGSFVVEHVGCNLMWVIVCGTK
ncbi:hypothetical protein B0H17DRAFT_1198251 [Mycena rosella]|uniref:Uncharacterized protein n=1 Tax=Mycena rosella TaxID=1033263 RepID=A0AAD7DQ85_MYCRO|nr:hypothetical protein B0H17DRAFT_1198251 [Mycena rosella]